MGVPAQYGGFETLAEYLVKYLNEEANITVYCSGTAYKDRLNSYNGAQLKYINLNANGVQSIPYDVISILKSLKHSDTILILGVSGCIILPVIKLFSKKNIIVNIDGLEWKRQKWSRFAKLFLKFSEKIAVKNATSVVTDNKVIQDYVYSEYNVSSHLIAYGADHVKKRSLSDEISNKYPFLDGDYYFKVCRIEPENNVEMIIKAFSINPNFKLVIVGNWQNSEYGCKLKEKYKVFDNLHLLAPIYDQDILNQIRSNCIVYVHGHSAGGTNPSLVEAMSLGLPIVAYGANYNQETTHFKAHYFDDVESLSETLLRLSKENIMQNSLDMKLISDQHYTWAKISKQYSDLF